MFYYTISNGVNEIEKEFTVIAHPKKFSRTQFSNMCKDLSTALKEVHGNKITIDIMVAGLCTYYEFKKIKPFTEFNIDDELVETVIPRYYHIQEPNGQYNLTFQMNTAHDMYVNMNYEPSEDIGYIEANMIHMQLLDEMSDTLQDGKWALIPTGEVVPTDAGTFNQIYRLTMTEEIKASLVEDIRIMFLENLKLLGVDINAS